MPSNGDTQKKQDLELEMGQFLQRNPNLRQALEVFGVTSAEYERLLANMNPPRTVTTNATSAVRLGE